MYRTRFDNTNYRINKRVVLILTVIWVICVAIFLYQKLGLAEDKPVRAYVICQHDDWVHARRGPSRDTKSLGRLETGDEIWLDGKTEDGWLHCVNATFEENECWVYSGYVVFDKPEWMNGRTATVVSNAKLAVRKNCVSIVRRWLKTGDEVQVFWYSNEWCVTNLGFVMTEWLELDGE